MDAITVSSLAMAEQGKCDVTTDVDDESIVQVLDDPEYIDSVTSTTSQTALLPRKVVDDTTKGKDKSQNSLLHPNYNNVAKSTISLAPVEEGAECRLNRHSTMKGLCEQRGYRDAVGSNSPHMHRLSRACITALELSKSTESLGIITSTQKKCQQEVPDLVIKGTDGAKQENSLRTILFLSIGMMFAYTAYVALRNLQSSLNHSGGTGLISLAGGYSLYMVGSLFGSFIIKCLRPKNAILMAIIFQTLYVCGNMYPSFYVLLPLSMLVGFGNALIWVATGTYLTYKARECSTYQGKTIDDVMHKFVGIFFMVYQLNYIFGNVFASIILGLGSENSSATINATDIVENTTTTLYTANSGNETQVDRLISFYTGNFTDSQSHRIPSDVLDSDITYCGANYCHHRTLSHGSLFVSDNIRYLLMGMFGVFEVIGFCIIFFRVDQLKTYKTKVEFEAVAREVKAVLGMFLDPTFLCLVPLSVFSGLVLAFLPGDIVKAFVTCPLSIQMVGYVMMAYGVVTALTSYCGSWLSRRFGRIPLISTACVIDIGVCLFMLLWRLVPGVWYPYILLVSVCGIADGIWTSQLTSLIGITFNEKSEEAHAAFRFLQGVGTTLAYSYAQPLCMAVKLYTTLGMCIAGLLGYILMEIREKKTKSHLTMDLDISE